MSLGTDAVTPPMRAGRTGLPPGIGRSGLAWSALLSNVLMSPRLLTESSRRSSWLYWSLVTPTHTHVPNSTTRVITAKAEMMTMVRNDSTRIGSCTCGNTRMGGSFSELRGDPTRSHVVAFAQNLPLELVGSSDYRSARRDLHILPLPW